MPQFTVKEGLEGNSSAGNVLILQFVFSPTQLSSQCWRFKGLPEEVGGPDDSQVFRVHVGDRAEGGQVGEMSH